MVHKVFGSMSRWLREAPVTSRRRRHGLVGPAGLWKMKRAFQIDFLREHGLRPDHTLLDLGCGTLRGGIPLIGYLDAGGYVGIDVREEVIAEAWNEAASCGVVDKGPSLHVITDLAGTDLGLRFDIIWAFQVMIHMSDDILTAAAGFVERHLKDTGRAFVSVRIGESRQREWQGFPAMTRPLEFYERAFGEAGLSVADLGPLTDHGHVLPHRTAEQQSPQRMLEIKRV